MAAVTAKPAIPNVLAGRYASTAMATIFGPEHKVVAERQLWLAVLRAQAELGIPTADGAVEPPTRRWSRPAPTRWTWPRSPSGSGSPGTT